MLQRLAVFKSAFTLDAAMGVVSCATLLPANLTGVMDSLVLKSLLSLEQGNGVSRFRFLNTTRSYALEKLEHSGALRTVEMRYAGYISHTQRPSDRHVAL
ncbi:putative HTH-type transcriptional regulator [compost metagenome]